MSKHGQREVDFDRLNLLGKVVYVTGTTFHVLGNVVESVVETLSGVVREAERAFKDGLDSDLDEATILDERKGDD